MENSLYIFFGEEPRFLYQITPNTPHLSRTVLYKVYEIGQSKPIGTLVGWEFSVTGSTFVIAGSTGLKEVVFDKGLSPRV